MEHETTYLCVYMEHETTYLIFKWELYNLVLLFLFFQFFLNSLSWTALFCSKSLNSSELNIVFFNIVHYLSMVVPSGIVSWVQLLKMMFK